MNPDDYVQITCVLRKDTVEQLREGAGGKQKFFGHFLQFHLDRYPLPTHEEYLAMRDRKPYFKLIKRRRVPVIFAGDVSRARRGAAARTTGKPPFRVRRQHKELQTPAFRKFLKQIQGMAYR